MNYVRARYPNGKRARGWRARVDRTCAGCGRTIKAGEVYTAHMIFPGVGGFYADKKQGFQPFCRTNCFPIKVVEDE